MLVSRAPPHTPSEERRTGFFMRRMGPVLGPLDRGQAYAPARYRRFSPPLAKKVAKYFVEAFRDAYGDALCLSAYYRHVEPGIRRALVLASSTSQRSRRGEMRTLVMCVGRLVSKRRSFFYCT
jgi:hypothetical protein